MHNFSSLSPLVKSSTKLTLAISYTGGITELKLQTETIHAALEVQVRTS